MKNIPASDAADDLDNEVVNAEFLNATLEDSNPTSILQAIADVGTTRP